MISETSVLSALSGEGQFLTNFPNIIQIVPVNFLYTVNTHLIVYFTYLVVVVKNIAIFLLNENSMSGLYIELGYGAGRL
jgi:hypothetical protein